MIKKISVLLFVFLLFGCGTSVVDDNVMDYDENDVELSDVNEELEDYVEEEVEEPQEVVDDSDKKKAEDKLADAKAKYKEERKALNNLRGNDSENRRVELESVRDLLVQAEKEFERGEYSKAIKFSDLVLDML